MRIRLIGAFVVVAVVAALGGAAMSRSLAQAPGPSPRTNARPERVEGRPNLSGIWQANNEAHWDLQAHAARPGAVTQPGVYPFEYARVAAAPVVALGAAAGVPASLGVVQGDGEIPYTPEARTIRTENAEHWIDRDPELKCYLPGIPRAMYMPYPFEITQSTNKIHMAYAFASTARTIHLDAVDPPPAETWMGHSVGRWEGDTLVVDVSSFNDKAWFDRAGNFHSDALHLTERFTLLSPDVIQYDVTIEDPKVFTRPWRIAMPIYRRLEPNMQLLEYRCTEFAEEFLYGHVRSEPLVKRWEGETMTVEITRRVPPGDRFYEWFRK
ncbi:MAG: hypothetical protein A3I61_08760 [Acidobacteria bacterium RIFCSPLOWO2_02_FULL_68_18]|nr:MAG: hypothetical protein A3I61_08760 [Acidobacteria bacterium RIFCSPLOWO2_02_FULL_68_18]OFW49799.1 MAG: hypothetical protein A3G77_01225 [Acidobacteria bacterium RIFCSPLOWO2_12_FULL_68_19]